MLLKRPKDKEAAAAAAKCVSDVHFALVDFLAAGQTLAEIDAFVATTLEQMNCKSAFLRYRIPGHPPFPSHSCLSPNDCVVHGTHVMTDKPIVTGDLLSIDIGVTCKGWIGDAAWTYGIEGVDDEAMRLMRAGRASLQAGVDAMQPGRPLLDWARAVEGCINEAGFSLVQGLGGHGYGRRLHGPPFISNVVPKRPGEWPDAFRTFEPGLLGMEITAAPMAIPRWRRSWRLAWWPDWANAWPTGARSRRAATRAGHPRPRSGAWIPKNCATDPQA